MSGMSGMSDVRGSSSSSLIKRKRALIIYYIVGLIASDLFTLGAKVKGDCNTY